MYALFSITCGLSMRAFLNQLHSQLYSKYPFIYSGIDMVRIQRHLFFQQTETISESSMLWVLVLPIVIVAYWLL